MGSIERDLNAYLFLEFGMEEEGEETSISETWPFSLRRLGEIGDRVIFEFDDADEPYFRDTRAMPGFSAEERHDYR